MTKATAPQPVYSAQGQEQIERLGSQTLIDAVASTSPSLAELLVNNALGGVLGRPDLDSRTRELLSIAMLAALGSESDYLAVHADAALKAGASPEELAEVVTQVATFAGFPAALRALEVVRESITSTGGKLPVARSSRAVVTSFFEHLNTGDVEKALTVVGNDAVWLIPGNADLLPWAGTHKGHEEIRSFYAQLNAETIAEGLNLGPIVGHGNLAFTRGEFSYTFPRTNGRYSGAFVIVFTVEAGLIQRYEMHEDSLGLARSFQNAQ